MNNKYIVAKIAFAHLSNNYCLAKANDGRTFFLARETGPRDFTLDPEGAAVFGGEFLVRMVRHGDMVLIEPGNYSRQHDKTYANSWGMLADAKATEATFVQPKTYVVYRRGRRDGKSGRWGQWEEFDRGGIDQLIHRHSARDGKRESSTDCLAPTYRTMGFVYETRFAQINEGKMLECGDPRPMAKTGPMYRVVRVAPGCEPRGLAHGDLNKISFEYPRLRSGQDTLKEGKHFQIRWYRMGSGGKWEDVDSDPRPFDEVQCPGEVVDMATALADQMTGKFGGHLVAA